MSSEKRRVHVSYIDMTDGEIVVVKEIENNANTNIRFTNYMWSVGIIDMNERQEIISCIINRVINMANKLCKRNVEVIFT